MNIEREDILIARAADARATGQEWEELRRLGDADPTVWDRLAEEGRAAALLSRGVQEAIGAADWIDIDTDRAGGGAQMRQRLRVWSGWAAAAAVALVWMGSAGWIGTGAGSGAPPTEMTAGFLGVTTADEALERYRALGAAEGRVVSELPTVMLESHADEETGRVEVLYLRRIVERAEIDAMYTAAENEHGRLEPIPVPIPVRNVSSSGASRLY